MIIISGFNHVFNQLIVDRYCDIFAVYILVGLSPSQLVSISLYFMPLLLLLLFFVLLHFINR